MTAFHKNRIFLESTPANPLFAGVFKAEPVEKPVENVENFFGATAEKSQNFSLYVNRYSVALPP